MRAGGEKTQGMAIYALIDPRDFRVRYIGLTGAKLPRRLKGHMSASSLHGKTPRSVWLRELDAAGVLPLIVELEDPSTRMRERERHWIHHAVALGFDLVNTVHARPVSAATRAKQRRARKAFLRRGFRAARGA